MHINIYKNSSQLTSCSPKWDFIFGSGFDQSHLGVSDLT